MPIPLQKVIDFHISYNNTTERPNGLLITKTYIVTTIILFQLIWYNFNEFPENAAQLNNLLCYKICVRVCIVLVQKNRKAKSTLAIYVLYYTYI